MEQDIVPPFMGVYNGLTLDGASKFPASAIEEVVKMVTIPIVETVIAQHALTLIKLLITWW